MSEPFQIGHYYSVLCAQSSHFYPNGSLRLVPLLGPLHEDAEIINFPERHWHVDWRFVSQKAWDHFSYLRSRLARPISENNVTGQLTRHRLKCKREMPIFPDKSRVLWLEKLEESFQNNCLKPGLICPHRGIPLAGCQVENSVVVCPGHGLAWNIESGKLVAR